LRRGAELSEAERRNLTAIFSEWSETVKVGAQLQRRADLSQTYKELLEQRLWKSKCLNAVLIALSGLFALAVWYRFN
jgi:hypothetical protein